MFRDLTEAKGLCYTDGQVCCCPYPTKCPKQLVRGASTSLPRAVPLRRRPKQRQAGRGNGPQPRGWGTPKNCPGTHHPNSSLGRIWGWSQPCSLILSLSHPSTFPFVQPKDAGTWSSCWKMKKFHFSLHLHHNTVFWDNLSMNSAWLACSTRASSVLSWEGEIFF